MNDNNVPVVLAMLCALPLRVFSVRGETEMKPRIYQDRFGWVIQIGPLGFCYGSFYETIRHLDGMIIAYALRAEGSVTRH